MHRVYMLIFCKINAIRSQLQTTWTGRIKLKPSNNARRYQ